MFNPPTYHETRGDSVTDIKRAVAVYTKLMQQKDKSIIDGYLKCIPIGNKESYALTKRARLEFLTK